jgi:hypothetical protein
MVGIGPPKRRKDPEVSPAKIDLPSEIDLDAMRY